TTSRVTRDAAGLLDKLAAWVGAVYLRYSDAVSGFPECWMWHPDVVEELLWLHHGWLAAYSPGASRTAVGERHDPQRPGGGGRIPRLRGDVLAGGAQPRPRPRHAGPSHADRGRRRGDRRVVDHLARPSWSDSDPRADRGRQCQVAPPHRGRSRMTRDRNEQ